MRSGLISFSCGKCQAAPYIKDTLGCEEPTQTPAFWFEKDEEWFNCPLKFITEEVLDFLNEYDSLKTNLARPKEYGEQSSKFYEAVRVLENNISKFVKEKEGTADGS